MQKSAENTEGQTAPRVARPVTPKEWVSLFCALMTLYAVVATLYYALLKASLEIRTNGYIELPNQFFGPFSKVERVLTDLSLNEVRKGNGNPTDTENHLRTFNLADGCEEVDGLLKCGEKDVGEKSEWAIFPWVYMVEPAPGCDNQRFTTLIPNAYKLEYGTKKGNLAEGVCLSAKVKPSGKGDTRS